jgi:hypothetical protein
MITHKTYKVGRDGIIMGIFDEPEMVYMISCGKVLGSDDYWTEGMSTWAKVSSREVWTVSAAVSSAPPPLPPSSGEASSAPGSQLSSSEWEIRREVLVEMEMERRRKLREVPAARPGVKAPPVSFFSIWWKTTLVIYAACAALGYLNSGEYGFGYMLGQGLVTAPLSALLFGGIIYAFSKNSGSAGRTADHAKVIREFDRSRVLKK